jgi:CHAD domain-containing protein
MSTANVTIPDKWIAGLDPEAPVAREIPAVLERRLDAVAEMVREVIKTSGSDDEAVHQLRVSTRRAQSVMLSFKPWLRKARRGRIKKVLKRLRDAAGVVRMCDVHRGLLTADLADRARPGAGGERLGGQRMAGEFALVRLDGERDDALAALVRAAKGVPVKRLTGDAERLIRDAATKGATGNGELDDGAAETEVDAGEASTVRAAGHAALARLADEFRCAGEADLSCRENLHQMRLAGKRLRYAVEIFGAAEENPEPLVALAEHLATFQDRLGAVNDHHEVAERLQRYASETAAAVVELETGESALAAGLHALSERFESRCSALASESLQWWNSDEARGFHDLINALAGRRAASMDEAEGREPEVVVLARSNGAVDERWPEDKEVVSAAAGDGAGETGGDERS